MKRKEKERKRKNERLVAGFYLLFVYIKKESQVMPTKESCSTLHAQVNLSYSFQLVL